MLSTILIVTLVLVLLGGVVGQVGYSPTQGLWIMGALGLETVTLVVLILRGWL